MKINLENETIKVKIIPHPGFNWANSYDRPETAVTKTCKFKNKVAIIGEYGAFFGNEPRFVEFESKHTFSCLTCFNSKAEAELFIGFLNYQIAQQLIARENLRLV